MSTLIPLVINTAITGGLYYINAKVANEVLDTPFDSQEVQGAVIFGATRSLATTAIKTTIMTLGKLTVPFLYLELTQRGLGERALTQTDCSGLLGIFAGVVATNWSGNPLSAKQIGILFCMHAFQSKLAGYDVF